MALPFSAQALTQAQDAVKPFELRGGVLVDPQKGRIYAMNLKGGIDSIDLAGGQVVWSNDAAARPVALTGGKLVGQADTGAEKGVVKLAILNPDNGRKFADASHRLRADDVRSSVTETSTGRFVASAAPAVDGQTDVNWVFTQARRAQGIAPAPGASARRRTRGNELAAKAAEAAPPVSSRTATHGAFRLNLETGATSELAAPKNAPAAPPPGNRINAPPAAERIQGVEGHQVLSADGRHVLVGKQVSEDLLSDAFLLTVYKRDNHEKVGAFRSRLPNPSYFVIDGRVYCETTPFTRPTAQGPIDEPAKIRAIDLTVGEGKELWSRPVRETTFRGPFPG
jgi:hypothetical protein